jgi:glutathione S-transferase
LNVYRFLKMPKNEAAYEESVKTLDAKLDGYERILAKQKYLAGDVRAFFLFDLCF